jgi:hypothetical protein
VTLLNFGQPSNGIMQLAYVVKDLHQAIEDWIGKLNVGPWFVLEHFTGEHPVYRGRQSLADVAIAMSFAGHMNIELIQPNDTHPSVYKEAVDARGYGFHHWGLATSDIERDIKRYEAMGMELAFRAGVPTGGDVAYMDSHGAMPGFVELISTNDFMERAFSKFYAAALSWDGSTPIRSFADG